jgi:hypothetical protein
MKLACPDLGVLNTTIFKTLLSHSLTIIYLGEKKEVLKQAFT